MEHIQIRSYSQWRDKYHKSPLAKSTLDNAFFAGTFEASTWRLGGCGYLFLPNEFDKGILKYLPTKEGEVILRYETETMLGHCRPFIKVNFSRELVYFLEPREDEVISFESRGVKMRWCNIYRHLNELVLIPEKPIKEGDINTLN